MSAALILAPVFVQIALTFALMVMMAQARFAAAKARQVKVSDIALGQTAPWPEKPAKIARAFHNQLETPVLFYVAVTLALVTGKADRVFVILEWAWLATRLAHAFVHVTSNHVPTRFRIFLGSVIALVTLWLWLAARVLVTG